MSEPNEFFVALDLAQDLVDDIDDVLPAARAEMAEHIAAMRRALDVIENGSTLELTAIGLMRRARQLHASVRQLADFERHTLSVRRLDT